MRGVAYALIPGVLEEHGILKNIVRVAGSSAGSIIATLIALKYSPFNIEEVFDGLSFDEFSDSVTYTGVLLNFLTSFGINSGAFFEDWIQNIIRMKTGSRFSSFSDLYELTGIELVITGTNMTSGKTEYFSYKTTPAMKVWQAVRISIAIPVFFKPVIYNGCMYVDGGVLSNYPIWIFDNPDTYEQGQVFNDAKTRKHRQTETLGFKLVSQDIQLKTTFNPYFIPVLSIVVRLIYLLVNYAYLNCDSYQASIRTVYINTMYVDSTCFKLDDEMKDQLKDNGMHATKNFLMNSRPKSPEVFIKKRGMFHRGSDGSGLRKSVPTVVLSGSQPSTGLHPI